MKRRGLLGFYIGAGVFAALALVAAFTWKPLAIGYYERQIKRKTPQGKEGPRTDGLVLWGKFAKRRFFHRSTRRSPEAQAAVRLVNFGPAAGPAFRRLLRSENGNVRDLATIVLAARGARGATWALPMLVELAQDEEENVAWQALITAELLTEQFFVPVVPTGTVGEWPRSLAASQQTLLDWWEKEGWAKYGSGQ